MEPIVLEVANELAPLIAVDAQIPMMRDGLFYELGVQLPDIEVKVGSGVAPLSARIVINGIPEIEFVVRPCSVAISDTVAALAKRGFTGERAVNLATGYECAWIPVDEAPAAMQDGLITWDADEFLVLSLSAILRCKAAQFIGTEEVRAMLEQIEPVFPQLVVEAVPKTVSLFVLTDVLRRLVDEEISIRDLRRILLAIVQAIRHGIAAVPEGYQMPPILAPMEIRSYVRRLVAPSMPRLFVICYHEVTPGIEIQPFCRIAVGGVEHRRHVTGSE